MGIFSQSSSGVSSALGFLAKTTNLSHSSMSCKAFKGSYSVGGTHGLVVTSTISSILKITTNITYLNDTQSEYSVVIKKANLSELFLALHSNLHVTNYVT